MEDVRRHRSLNQVLSEVALVEASLPFDLTRGPLVRARLLLVADDLHVLLLTLHHIVGDGVSFDVLERELKQLYEHSSAAVLPPLALDYADYAQWQRQSVAPLLAGQLQYWRELLGDDLAPIELPYDRPHPASASFTAASLELAIDAKLATVLLGVARKNGVTMFMMLLAAWQYLLHVYTRQETVTVGAPIAGRTRAEFDETVGIFVNTLVLRSRFERTADLTLPTLLAQVKRNVLGAFDHQDVPFEQLVKELQPERDERRNPLFQVFFDVVNADAPTLAVPRAADLLDVASPSSSTRPSSADPTLDDSSSNAGTSTASLDSAQRLDGKPRLDPERCWRLGEALVETREPPVDSTQFELSLTVRGSASRGKGALLAELEYATELFDRDTVLRLGEHFLCLLRRLAARPLRDTPLHQISLLTADERELERLGWNAPPETTWPRTETLPSLFAAQAARTPDAAAVIDPVGDVTNSVTYAELLAQSNCVAAHLAATRKRHPSDADDSLVGVLMARGAPLLAALFGVMRSGAAYVPLDAAWPAERLAYVAQDAQLEVIVTDRATWEQWGAPLQAAFETNPTVRLIVFLFSL